MILASPSAPEPNPNPRPQVSPGQRVNPPRFHPSGALITPLPRVTQSTATGGAADLELTDFSLPPAETATAPTSDAPLSKAPFFPGLSATGGGEPTP